MVLDKIKSDKLQVFVVWIPVLKADIRDFAEDSSKMFTDKRVKQYWDGDKKLGNAFGKVVELPERRGKRLTLAWDIYFAFDAETEWKKEPPKPDYWMHQLGQDDRRWDGDKFRKEVQKLLKAIK